MLLACNVYKRLAGLNNKPWRHSIMSRYSMSDVEPNSSRGIHYAINTCFDEITQTFDEKSNRIY
jgi:hypothetical protein